jgi:hypothetical protein
MCWSAFFVGFSIYNFAIAMEIFFDNTSLGKYTPNAHYATFFRTEFACKYWLFSIGCLVLMLLGAIPTAVLFAHADNDYLFGKMSPSVQSEKSEQNMVNVVKMDPNNVECGGAKLKDVDASI